jgi:hypothetical protein
MTAVNFCYWLQGFFEVSLEDRPITVEQMTIIRQHLHLVFKHEIDPSLGDEEHIKELQQIHKPSKGKGFDPASTLITC